jgi:DNA-binding transcriptional LysR family regulator
MDILEALHLYVTIAETGSPSAAARQVSVSNSTVTVALQKLEVQARVSLPVSASRHQTPENLVGCSS